MKFIASIWILPSIFSAVFVKALPTSTFQEASVNKILFDYLLSPDTVNALADQAGSAACFSQYLPQLAEIGTTYSTQYQACITQAQAATTTLVDNASTNRTDFIAITKDVCNAYQQCDTNTDILGFFDCYASVSDQDVSVLYTLSTNATSAAATLSAGLRLIQQEEQQCINTTENTYVQNTAATYKALNECLEKANAPTVAPVTFAPVNTNVETFVEQKDCSTGSGTRIQISPDGSQIQTQTGTGCQSQSSDSSSSGSQSQSQSGGGTQSQCSGADCGELKPLFTMAPMLTMAPMMQFN